MKTYEVTGYTFNADTYCIEHTRSSFPYADAEFIQALDSEGNAPYPITVGSEWDYQPVCGVCHQPIEVTVIGEKE